MKEDWWILGNKNLISKDEILWEEKERKKWKNFYRETEAINQYYKGFKNRAVLEMI